MFTVCVDSVMYIVCTRLARSVFTQQDTDLVKEKVHLRHLVYHFMLLIQFLTVTDNYLDLM